MDAKNTAAQPPTVSNERSSSRICRLGISPFDLSTLSRLKAEANVPKPSSAYNQTWTELLPLVPFQGLSTQTGIDHRIKLEGPWWYPTLDFTERRPVSKSCQICGDDFRGTTNVFCVECDTPHHLDCFEFSGQCSTFNCGSREMKTALGRRVKNSAEDKCLNTSEVSTSKDSESKSVMIRAVEFDEVDFQRRGLRRAIFSFGVLIGILFLPLFSEIFAITSTNLTLILLVFLSYIFSFQSEARIVMNPNNLSFEERLGFLGFELVASSWKYRDIEKIKVVKKRGSNGTRFTLTVILKSPYLGGPSRFIYEVSSQNVSKAKDLKVRIRRHLAEGKQRSSSRLSLSR